jgi:hypothetical protein
VTRLSLSLSPQRSIKQRKNKVREGKGEEGGGGGQTMKKIQAVGSPDIKTLWAV